MMRLHLQFFINKFFITKSEKNACFIRCQKITKRVASSLEKSKTRLKIIQFTITIRLVREASERDRWNAFFFILENSRCFGQNRRRSEVRSFSLFTFAKVSRWEKFKTCRRRTRYHFQCPNSVRIWLMTFLPLHGLAAII